MNKPGVDDVEVMRADSTRDAPNAGGRIPQVSIRPGRFNLLMGAWWLAYAIGTTFSSAMGSLFAALGVMVALGWLAVYFLYQVSITHDVVVVRRGLFQEIYRTGDFLYAHTGPDRELLIGDTKVKFGFPVRPALVIETICELRGIEVPARFAINPKPKTETIFHGRVRGLL